MTLNKDQLQEYRASVKDINESANKSKEQFDKALLTLSSAALGIIVSFQKGVFVSSCLLKSSMWIFVGTILFTLIGVLFSYYGSQAASKYLRLTIEISDYFERTLEDTGMLPGASRPSEFEETMNQKNLRDRKDCGKSLDNYNLIVDWVTPVSGILFLLGIILAVKGFTT